MKFTSFIVRCKYRVDIYLTRNSHIYVHKLIQHDITSSWLVPSTHRCVRTLEDVHYWNSVGLSRCLHFPHLYVHTSLSFSLQCPCECYLVLDAENTTECKQREQPLVEKSAVLLHLNRTTTLLLAGSIAVYGQQSFAA